MLETFLLMVLGSAIGNAISVLALAWWRGRRCPSEMTFRKDPASPNSAGEEPNPRRAKL